MSTTMVVNTTTGFQYNENDEEEFDYDADGHPIFIDDKVATSSNNLFVTDPEKWLFEFTRNHDFCCIILFGPEDRAYVERLADTAFHDQVYMIAWTAEGPEAAARYNQEWELQSKHGYNQVLGDNTHMALAKWFEEDDILPGIFTPSTTTNTMEHEEDGGKFCCGTGLVLYAHHGSMVLHWNTEATILPQTTTATATTAKEYPMATEVWKNVLKRKHALDLGNAIMPVHGDRLPVEGSGTTTTCSSGGTTSSGGEGDGEANCDVM